MSIIEAATPYLFVLSLFGMAYIYRGTITLMLKILIAEFIDREEKLESRIYRAQTVERAKVSGKDPVSLDPPEPPSIDAVLELDKVRHNQLEWMHKMTLEMDVLKNDILPRCNGSDELRNECTDRIDKLEKMIRNGS